MVKKIEVTYDGGHKETITYERIVRDTKEDRVYQDAKGNYITVMKDKVLQFREMM